MSLDETPCRAVVSIGEPDEEQALVLLAPMRLTPSHNYGVVSPAGRD